MCVDYIDFFLVSPHPFFKISFVGRRGEFCERGTGSDNYWQNIVPAHEITSWFILILQKVVTVIFPALKISISK